MEDTYKAGVPGLVTWIMAHSFFETTSNRDLKPQTLYIHPGNRSHVDIKLVSKQLSFSYDKLRIDVFRSKPERGCFYFEFDRHDSRRSGLKAMITSFICSLVCRFGWFDQAVVRMCQEYLSRHQSWTWIDLTNMFQMVLERCSTVEMTMVLVQIDHLEDFEVQKLSYIMKRLQNFKERPIRCIMTTTKPLDLICEDVGPQNVINLEDCPLLLKEVVCVWNPPTCSFNLKAQISIPKLCADIEKETFRRHNCIRGHDTDSGTRQAAPECTSGPKAEPRAQEVREIILHPGQSA